MIVNWVPCVDGLFLPDQEERIVEGCKANNVDMLVGNTTNEFIASTEDGKPVHVGQLGNLTLIRKWIASGGTAPYYYHFDVAMPGMMPEPSTHPICGSPLEALRNAGVRSLDGITIWQGEWGCTGPILPPMAIPTERTVTERRFLYGILASVRNAPPCIYAKNRACGRIGLPKRIEKHSACDGMPLMYKY